MQHLGVRIGQLLAWLCLVAAMLLTRVSRADEQRELDRGRNAYLARQYDEAEARLRAMLDPKSGTLHDPLFIDQAYMYWAAAMVAQKRSDEAQKIFEQLILRSPEFEPDPLSFPTDVLDAFTDTKSKIRDKLTLQAQDAAKREAERKAREESLRRRERERVRELEQLASEDKTLERHRRWLAFVPFGLGQFQNGKPALGYAFLGVESAALVTSALMFPFYISEVNAARAAYQPNNSDFARQEALKHRDAAATYAHISWVALGVFALGAIGGATEANLNYVPDVLVIRKRPLPPPVSFTPRIDLGSTPRLTLEWQGSF